MAYVYRAVRVEKPEWEKIPAVTLTHQPWLAPCDIEASAQLCHDGENLYVRMTAKEKNIRATLTGPLDQVCNDSCLEFFFSPICGDTRYLNFEFNPNGCLYLGIGSGIHDLVRLLPEEEALFQPQPRRTGSGWEITYRIPTEFIRRFFPGFTAAPGASMRANFFKCGDLTPQPHFLAWNPVTSETPAFHRPCDFGLLTFG